MSVTTEINRLRATLPSSVTLVAVSKLHPAEAIEEAYATGQRIFGESRPQELAAKYELLPKDICWHMIGHLQTNKVRLIAPFVEMIHSVDSVRLLSEIDRQAERCGRRIDVLFEIHLSAEDTKSGLSESEFCRLLQSGELEGFKNVRPRGLMTVATQTDDTAVVEAEFRRLKTLFESVKGHFGTCFDTLSMGMTSDYPAAIAAGSTMVRIGSLIFGERDYSK